MIADDVLRRQLNPMEQARLIQRLKKMLDIKNGKNNSSVKMTEVAQKAGVAKERHTRRINQLNALIPPLHAIIFLPPATSRTFTPGSRMLS